MLARVFRFELNYQLRRPAFYICWVTMLLLLLLFISTLMQKADEVSQSIHINAPLPIALLLAGMQVFSLLILVIFFGGVVLRDQERGMEELVKATVVPLPGLLLMRYLAVFIPIAVMYISAVPVVEFALHTIWETDFVRPFNLKAYAYSHAILILPNLFIFSAIIFSIVAWTRSNIAGYLFLIVFSVLFLVIHKTGLMRSAPWVCTISDPSGVCALKQAAQYWTQTEYQTNFLPYSVMFLWNRLIWVGTGAVLLIATLVFIPRSVGSKRKAAPEATTDGIESSYSPVSAVIPGRATVTDQIIKRIVFETSTMLRGSTFPLMLLLLVGLCWSWLSLPDIDANKVFYPVSVMIASKITEASSLIGALTVIIFAGESVWRERKYRVSEIVYSTPTSNMVFYIGKLGATTVLITIFVMIAVATGIVFQILNGSSTVQLGIYFSFVTLELFIPLVMLSVVTIFIHMLSINSAMGHIAVAAFLASQIVAFLWGIEDSLVQFATFTPLLVSEMNGFGQYLTSALWYHVYWGAVSVLLAALSLLVWHRHKASLFSRLRAVPSMLNVRVVATLFIAASGAVSAGSYIYWNTHVLNQFHTSWTIEKAQVHYERLFGIFTYTQEQQPQVTDIELEVDLDAKDRVLESRGKYTLTNKTDEPIDHIRVQFSDDLKVQEVVLDNAKLVSKNSRFNNFVFKTNTELSPGDTVILSFATRLSNAGFRHQVYRTATPVNNNGSMVLNSLFSPWIGVNTEFFLKDAVRRSKFGLRPLSETEEGGIYSKRRNFISHDSDRVSLKITLSTDADQTAVAPGVLKRKWKKNGRNFFHYETDQLIGNYWSVLSARYNVAKDNWKDTDLAVYYHPEHKKYVPRMLRAMRESLDYFSKEFGPFQFGRLRIAEYPYGNVAISFPQTIAYPELGFLSAPKQGAGTDHVTMLTAHEVAHQWWGHQAIPANMPGAQLLSETLAEYSALMVIEKTYGPDLIREYLKRDLDYYLSRRSYDGAEKPLSQVRLAQEHIAYRKGAVAMYALRDAIGEKALNSALRRYLEKFRYKSDPYPTASDLIAILREAAGPEHAALIDDLFEKIILWDFKVNLANVIPLKDGKWRVSVTVSGNKYETDPYGAESSVPMRNNVDIGIFTEDPSSEAFASTDVIVLEKRVINGAPETFEFITNEKPRFVGINPYLKLIERNSGDNIVATGY